MPSMTPKQRELYKKAETTAWCRVSAYIIIKNDTVLKGDSTEVGRIKIAYPTEGQGSLHVWVWDTKSFAGYGTEKGHGFDKLSSALSNIEYDGQKMENNSDGSGQWKDILKARGYTVIEVI